MSAITTGEIKFYLTESVGPGNNTTSTPSGSLGGFISTSQWTGGTINDLFDDVTGDENAASNIEYRCVAIRNTNSTNTAQSFVVWVSAEVSGGTSVAIAVDSHPDSIITDSNHQAVTIINEDTAPDPLPTFSTPTTKGTGLPVGDIAPGYCRMIWIRRTAANSSAKDGDGFTLSWACDTAA
jgi:hypothetical protein